MVHQELVFCMGKKGDGRAPKGEITLIASLFTKAKDWFDLEKKEYIEKKKRVSRKNVSLSGRR